MLPEEKKKELEITPKEPKQFSLRPRTRNAKNFLTNLD